MSEILWSVFALIGMATVAVLAVRWVVNMTSAILFLVAACRSNRAGVATPNTGNEGR